MTGVYNGKALESMERIMGNKNKYLANIVYKTEKSVNCVYYWYMNTKGYLHILISEVEKMDKKVTACVVNDYMLTKDNKLKYSRNLYRIKVTSATKTLTEKALKMKDLLESLIDKNID